MPRGHGDRAHLLSCPHTEALRLLCSSLGLWRQRGDGPWHHTEQREQPWWLSPSPASPSLVPPPQNPSWPCGSWLFFSLGINNKQTHNQKEKRDCTPKCILADLREHFTGVWFPFLITFDLRPRVNINWAEEQSPGRQAPDPTLA